MISRPLIKTHTLGICLAVAMNSTIASAAHVLPNHCFAMLRDQCLSRLFYTEPNLESITFYDTSEIDSQMASLKAQLQTAQGGVESQLTQFNQAAERRISEAVAKILVVNDPDRPTEIQQPLIRTIRQIVRQEVQQSLQQTQ